LRLIGSEKQDVGKEVEADAVKGTKAESSRARLWRHRHLLPKRLPSAKTGDEDAAPDRGFFRKVRKPCICALNVLDLSLCLSLTLLSPCLSLEMEV
jgi:hypothetical protein